MSVHVPGAKSETTLKLALSLARVCSGTRTLLPLKSLLVGKMSASHDIPSYREPNYDSTGCYEWDPVPRSFESSGVITT